ncbi:MAG: serine/threonine protein kinase [Bacteroidales bacterium]|nr:serine/threonine protein kinase [Bacteroidales bacterium]
MTDKTSVMTKESGIFEKEVFLQKDNDNFNDYKLLKTTVYSKLWRVSRDGKYFLIKTTKNNSEYQQKMLRREYEISIGCDNPNIVHVFTYERNLPEGEGIVMEYIEGRTLDEFLLEKPSLKTKQRIFGELLSAVNYLHKRGIIHNDLKPENILITRADNTLKIIDFGLADNDAFYVLKTLGCTQRYASPELLSQDVRARLATSKQKIDARSDIYSIGIIMQDIFDGRYKRIINKCIKENVGSRYPDISSLQRKWNDRNKVWKYLAVIVILLVAAFPTYLYLSEENAEKKEIAIKEAKIAEIKKDVRAFFEDFINDLKSHTDAEGYIELSEYSELMSGFVEEYTQFINDKVYTLTDDELKQRAFLEMTSNYNTFYNEFVNMVKVKYD